MRTQPPSTKAPSSRACGGSRWARGRGLGAAVQAVLPVVTLLVLAACSDPSSSYGRNQAELIYGSDDRLDVYEVPVDSVVGRVGRRSVVAMVPAGVLRTAGSAVTLDVASWAETQTLCDGVRFGQQPSAAVCSGVLVDSDLVLTAGHCAQLCARSKFVLGWLYEAENQLRPTSEADVFECTDVVADQRSAEGVDYAWLRLDRSVGSNYEPAVLNPTLPEPSETLTLASFPGGVPMKLDAGGRVESLAGDVFLTSHDAFAGSSGGPLLDPLGQVLGILGGGAADLTPTPENCYEPVVSSHVGIERATTTARALVGLCEAEHSVLCDAYVGGEVPRGVAAGCSVSRPGSAGSGWGVALLCGALLGWRCRGAGSRKDSRSPGRRS